MIDPTTYRRRLAAAGLLAVTLSIGACASTKEKAPTAALATARTAIAEAESAGAMQSSPATLLDARDKLQRAEAAVREERFQYARQLAERAEADALLAERRSRAARAQIAADELTRSNELLRREAERAIRR